jgi:hypothetical protein
VVSIRKSLKPKHILPESDGILKHLFTRKAFAACIDYPGAFRNNILPMTEQALSEADQTCGPCLYFEPLTALASGQCCTGKKTGRLSDRPNISARSSTGKYNDNLPHMMLVKNIFSQSALTVQHNCCVFGVVPKSGAGPDHCSI